MSRHSAESLERWTARVFASCAQDDTFGAYMTHRTDDYRRRGGDAARIPGQRAALLERQRRRDGIDLSGALLAELQSLGHRLELPLPKADGHLNAS